MEGSGASGGGDEGNGRTPRDMQGLLKFCMENTASEDAPASSEHLAPMDREKRKFLEEVFASLAENDPVKRMVQALEVIVNESSEVEQKEAELENIEQLCEDIDLSSDFYKVGGFQILASLLQNNEEGLRWRCLDLIATLVQNHPFCQEKILEGGFLPMILRILDSDPAEQPRIKALYALSCLTRDVPKAQEEFVKNDGFSVLIRAVQSNIEKLQIKSSFMMHALCVSQPKFKDMLCDLGMVEQLAALLQGNHSSVHEHLLRALLSLAKDHPQSQRECRRADLKLEQILTKKLQELTGKPEFEEEVEYSKELLQLCFSEQCSQTQQVEQ